jgi:hypothetical protein
MLDLVLDEAGGDIGKEVFVAFCLGVPGGDIFFEGGGQGKMVMIKSIHAPIDDFSPIFVLCDAD